MAEKVDRRIDPDLVDMAAAWRVEGFQKSNGEISNSPEQPEQVDSGNSSINTGQSSSGTTREKSPWTDLGARDVLPAADVRYNNNKLHGVNSYGHRRAVERKLDH